MRRAAFLLMCMAVLLMAVCCTGNRGVDGSDSKAWKDKLDAAFAAHDIQQVLVLVDSLEQTGDINTQYADYLRGRGYNFCSEQNRVAEYYYKRAYDALRLNPKKEWWVYAEAGYRAAALRSMRSDLEGALTIATEMMAVAEKNREFPISSKAALLGLIANCQHTLNQNEQARHNYQLAYEAQVQAVGGEGKGVLNVIIAGMNYAQFLSSQGEYDEAEAWLQRCEKEFQIFQQHGDSTLIEEYKGHFALSKVLLLQATGHSAEAAAAYDAIPRSRILNIFGISEAMDYLMKAGRYGEVADYYTQLDSSCLATDGAEMNFENIVERLARRYVANRKAGRTEAALTIADEICENMDSALVWQNKSDASELAVIYHTQEREMALKSSEMQTHVYRILFFASILIALLVGYLLLRAYQYNKVLTAKNRSLYEQIQKREQAEADEREQLQAQPEENLTTDQQLYRRLCALMDEQQAYTQETLNRDGLAHLLGSNAKYVEQAIRICSHGETPGDFINRYRLEHVARLLKTTEDPIAIIGEQAGIPSRATLARLFRNTYGMSCREFRQAAKEE